MCYLFLPKYRTIKPFEIGANYIYTSIYVCTYVVVKQISLVYNSWYSSKQEFGL